MVIKTNKKESERGSIKVVEKEEKGLVWWLVPFE